MAKNKTSQTESSVSDFLKSIPDDLKRNDCVKITEILKRQTGYDPKMWGPSIVGFGSYHYKYDSGHEGDAPIIGFSPRKDSISLYFSSNFDNKDQLLEKFGKHKAGKGCINIKKLDDIDIEVFKEISLNSFNYLKSLFKAKNYTID